MDELKESAYFIKELNTFETEWGFSCMGYEISGALGMKMAKPDQDFIVFIGDGSYLLQNSDFLLSLNSENLTHKHKNKYLQYHWSLAKPSPTNRRSARRGCRRGARTRPSRSSAGGSPRALVVLVACCRSA